MQPGSLKVLDGQQAQEIFLLLLGTRQARASRGPVDGATLEIRNSSGLKTEVRELQRLPWQMYVEMRARQTVLALDDLLARFQAVKGALKMRAIFGTGKRRRPVKNFWLATEITDVLESMPGFEITTSKRRPTAFTRILRICFSAIGHSGSIERVAQDIAKSRKETNI